MAVVVLPTPPFWFAIAMIIPVHPWTALVRFDRRSQLDAT